LNFLSFKSTKLLITNIIKSIVVVFSLINFFCEEKSSIILLKSINDFKKNTPKDFKQNNFLNYYIYNILDYCWIAKKIYFKKLRKLTFKPKLFFFDFLEKRKKIKNKFFINIKN
jgi:hypothetical protein